MVIRILPPDEAKKRARANLATWKREKAIKAAKERLESSGDRSEAPIISSSYGRQRELDRRLLEASKLGKTEIVRKLLEMGAQVDARTSSNYETGLMLASINGHKETVELLLERGAEVNTICADDITVLQYASFNGHEEIIALLKRFGAKERLW